MSFQPQKDSADKHTCPKLIIKTLNQGFECCIEITQSYPLNVMSTKDHIYLNKPAPESYGFV